MKISLKMKKKIYLDKIKELNINILEKKVNILGTYPNEKKSSENIAKKNILIKTNLFECESKIREMMYDIDDSEQFIKELENKQKSLQDAILVNSSLKGFIFDTCPCCQNKLKNRLHNECSLCGNELIEEGTNKNLLRMKNEIDLQLIESNKILLKDKIDFNNLKQEKKQIRTELRKTIVESSSVITSLNSNNENLLYSNYQQIGSLEEKILHLDKIKELLESISLLTNERDEIQLKINRLKDNIEKKKNLYRIREPEIKKIISEELISILRLDIGSEKEFKQAETVDFDFASNSISINGKSAFSESGMIFLYNSFKLALLLASLKKEYVRIPRFMILDGIENGGMEDSRSKNFQKIIHDKLLNSNVEFQIIFATKSIEPSLDNCDYIIGDTFSENKKSLNV
ncbi:hypothetical protein AYY25_01010 [Photobacterium phosphoreum]|nr:hypothetical protein AYY25_01010 [Photobacterium phosphoreum]